MSDKVVSIHTGALASVNKDWSSLPEKKQQQAKDRYVMVEPILASIDQGATIATAIEHLLAHIRTGQCDQNVIVVAKQLGRSGKPPSQATIRRWVTGYQQQGVAGLVSNSKGRQRKDYGWEARALYWHQKPSKLAAATIANLLTEEGFDNVSESRVRRYLQSLPDDVANKKRMGSKLYRDTQTPARIRNCDVVPVGAVYQGDGHTIDVYLKHPATGKPWRPELTVWIDVRSRYIVGFYLTEAESSISTLLSLSKAIIDHDHVPAALHIDNGSGYKSQMMNDESVGFYQRFDISTLFALPGNSKGKGQVERFFRTLRDGFDKTWDSYCGDDMAEEAKQRVLKKVRQGKGQLPDVRDYLQALSDWIDGYHARAHRGLDGDTPANVWSALERVPVHIQSAAVVRCQIKRTVRRGSIHLHNREYRHAELQPFNRREITVEYDLFDDAVVTVLTNDGRRICDATLTHKIDYLPASRLQEYQQRRLEGQVKRLNRHIEEKRERSRDNIDHAAVANFILDDGNNTDSLEAIDSGTTLIDTDSDVEQPADLQSSGIDIFDTDY